MVVLHRRIAPEHVDRVSAQGGAEQGKVFEVKRKRIDHDGAVVTGFEPNDMTDDDIDPPGVHVVPKLTEPSASEGIVTFVEVRCTYAARRNSAAACGRSDRSNSLAAEASASTTCDVAAGQDGPRQKPFGLNSG